MADRLSQVAGHLSNTYGRGLLKDEVAIITGVYCPCPTCQQTLGLIQVLCRTGGAQVLSVSSEAVLFILRPGFMCTIGYRA